MIYQSAWSQSSSLQGSCLLGSPPLWWGLGQINSGFYLSFNIHPYLIIIAQWTQAIVFDILYNICYHLWLQHGAISAGVAHRSHYRRRVHLYPLFCF